MLSRTILRVGLVLVTVVAAGLLLPERAIIPVDGATSRDWNPKSFWFEPWGVSGVHKGIDIFATQGTAVRAAVHGLVIYRGEFGQGGNVVAILGPKWRLHYYAHLEKISKESPVIVLTGSRIGTVGASGNAAGKPPHLHYSVFSLVPIPWRYSSATQGWRQMFYLDPGALLKNGIQSGKASL